MIGLISTIAAMIPGLSQLVTAITNAWFNAKVQITAAKIGGNVEVAKQLVTVEAQNNATGVDRLKVIASSKVLLAIVVGFAAPYIIYEWQAIVWDKVVMHGTTSTDPITGPLADWSTIILTGIFGSSSVLAIGHMYFNKKE